MSRSRPTSLNQLKLVKKLTDSLVGALLEPWQLV